jgi:hypothetical protein
VLWCATVSRYTALKLSYEVQPSWWLKPLVYECTLCNTLPPPPPPFAKAVVWKNLEFTCLIFSVMHRYQTANIMHTELCNI